MRSKLLPLARNHRTIRIDDAKAVRGKSGWLEDRCMHKNAQNVQKHLLFRIVRSMIIGAVAGSTSLSSIYFAQVANHQNEKHRSFWGLFLSRAAFGAFIGYAFVKDGKEVDVTGSQIASDPSVAQRLTAAQPTADLLSISTEATLSVNTDNNPSSSVKPVDKERRLRGIPNWTLLRHIAFQSTWD